MRRFFGLWIYCVLLAVWLGTAVDTEASSTPFSFTLDEPCKTSAGVFTPDGTLVRTLWSKVRYTAGTNTAVWDGLDDNSNAVSAGVYQIKVLQHNTEYVWDGAVGNTSAELSGPTIHRGFYQMRDMAIAGTNAFYVSGYNEGLYDFRNFLTTDPQHVRMSWYWVYNAQFNRVNNSPGDIYDLTWLCVAADASRVYFACSATPNPANVSVPNAYPGCIVSCNVGDNSPAYFANGVQIVNNGVNSPLPSGIYVGTQPGLSGMAVQQNGNLLAASVAPDNRVYLMDKTTGANISSLSVSSPGRLNFSPDGSLWVISGSNVICFTSPSANPSAALTISTLSHPLDVAVNPTNPGIVLIADGGTSQQVKAYNNAGASLWTYGLAGGYQANGMAVTTNKFWFYNGEAESTFVCFAPDGSFWVGDGGNHRSMHFSASLNYLEQIMYQPHSYIACVDQNNPSRVFNQFLEFKVDYTKPLSQGWTLVNNWKANVDPAHISWNEGITEVTTFTNGHTYALIDNNNFNPTLKELYELTTNQLRLTGILPLATNAQRCWVSLGSDGSARGTTIGSAQWFQSTLSGFDASNNPIWNPETLLASAPENSADPVPRCCSFGNVRATISSNNILISFDQSLNNGWHLGGIRVGAANWLWRASPVIPFNDGRGTYEIGNGVTYAGNTVQAVDRQVIFGYHGEFFRSQGEACQTMHFYDDGLFIGQFGEATPGHNTYEGALPGSASNGHCPSLTKTTNGDYYLWVNDEGGHGPQRWHFVNARNIREQLGSGTLGSAITLTNQPDGFPTGVTAKSGNQSGELSWLPVPGATGYNLRYSLINGGPCSTLAGSTTGLNYVIGGLTNGQNYYFAVSAIQNGVEGIPSEQVVVNPFDTSQSVLSAGSMTEGGQFTPTVQVSSTAPASGQASYIGSEQYTGVLNPRELDYYGYGNLKNDTFGAEGYLIYDWKGYGAHLTNLLDSITMTLGSGWIDFPFLERQYRVDGNLGTNDGLLANPLASINIGVSDTNFHFLTVISPAEFNFDRQFTMRLTSTNNSSVAYSVNESPGLSHVFQFLFRGNATLWADGTGGAGAFVQAIFLDNAQVTYSPPSLPSNPPTASATTLVSSSNPVVVGSTVTFTATVSGSGSIPTGTVSFLDGTSTIGSGTLNSSGVTTFSTTTLSASGSPHAITAVYGGNGSFTGSTSSVVSQVITNLPPTSTTTTITSSSNPALAGTVVTFTAVVSGSGGIPTGTVSFLDGASTIGSGTLNSSGVTTFGTAALSASGSPHAITAVYSGSSSFTGSTSSIVSQVITNAPSGSGSPGITNGLVAWYPLAGDANDYSGQGNNGLLKGSPAFTTGVTGAANSALSLNGSSQYVSLGHPALYNFGTGNFTVSIWFKTIASSTRQQLISCDDSSGRQFDFEINDFVGAPVLTYLYSSGASYGYEGGDALVANTWYLATFVKTGNIPGAVKLFINGSPVSSSAAFGSTDFPFTIQTTTSEVDIGHRTLAGYSDFFSGSLAGLRVFNRALSAAEINTVYTNDLAGGTVTSPPPATSTTTLVSSVNPALAGSTVTFTATVSGSGSIPAGTVSFLDGTSTIGSGTLNSSGVTTFGTTTLSASGSPHAITAVYGGSSTFAGSTSSIVSQVITNLPLTSSTTTITSSSNPALAGTTVTLTATVSGSGGIPTGTVSFLDGASTIGSGTLNSSGVTTFGTAALSASGSPHAITAVYGGSSAFAGSTSSIVSQVITNAPGLPASPGITNGLVAWYPLAGDANDYSGQGNNGLLKGSPAFTTGVTGTANSALSLNGSSQYVSLGHPTLYNFGTGNFTVSIWFKTTASSTRQQLFSCDDSSGRQFDFEINDFVGAPVLTYLYSSGASYGYEGGNALVANTWYLATFVKTGNIPGSVKLFINGSPVSSSAAFGSTDFPFAIQTTTSEVDIGRRTLTGFNDFFSGSLAGLRVFNRALSASEINTVYTNDLAGGTVTNPPPGPSASSTTLVSSSNPSLAGATVTFTATVSGSGSIPTGTVSFLDGTSTIGAGTLNSSGVTTFGTTALSASGSPHAITAVYGGSSSFTGSTSSVVSQVITNLPLTTTTTTITSSSNPALAGTVVSFTATVSGSGGVPTGTVSFLDGASTIGSGTLNSSGVTTFGTTALSASGSSHAITAVYGGSSTFAGSTSSIVSQVITNAPSGSGSPGITNGLVAWYPLAGDANDYSGQGNNGILKGSPTFTTGVTGAANAALSLNGSSQYVSLGHPTLYNFGTGNFTVSIWFKTTASSTRQQLFSCDDSSGRQFDFEINDFVGAPVLTYLYSSGASYGYEGGNALVANTWYLATFVKTGNAPGAVKLFINGSPVSSSAAFGSTDFPFTIQTTTSEVDIGHRTLTGYNDFFSGSLAGLRVFNRALSATEINTVYTNGTTGGIF